jgi:hypothetical protein
VTGPEFRSVLSETGLTMYSAAKFLGVNRMTPYRYGTGRHPVPGPTAKLLRLMRALRLSPIEVDALIANAEPANDLGPLTD